MTKHAGHPAILSYSFYVPDVVPDSSSTPQVQRFNERVKDMGIERSKTKKNSARYPTNSELSSSSGSPTTASVGTQKSASYHVYPSTHHLRENISTGVHFEKLEESLFVASKMHRRDPTLSSLDADSLFSSPLHSVDSSSRRTGLTRAKSNDFVCPCDGPRRQQQRRRHSTLHTAHDLFANVGAGAPKRQSVLAYGKKEEASEIRTDILKQMHTSDACMSKRHLDVPKRRDGIYYPNERGNLSTQKDIGKGSSTRWLV